MPHIAQISVRTTSTAMYETPECGQRLLRAPTVRGEGSGRYGPLHDQVSNGPDGQFQALVTFVLSLRVPETVGKGRRQFVIPRHSPFFLALNCHLCCCFSSAETATAAAAINWRFRCSIASHREYRQVWSTPTKANFSNSTCPLTWLPAATVPHSPSKLPTPPPKLVASGVSTGLLLIGVIKRGRRHAELANSARRIDRSRIVMAFPAFLQRGRFS